MYHCISSANSSAAYLIFILALFFQTQQGQPLRAVVPPQSEAPSQGQPVVGVNNPNQVADQLFRGRPIYSYTS